MTRIVFIIFFTTIIYQFFYKFSCFIGTFEFKSKS